MDEESSGEPEVVGADPIWIEPVAAINALTAIYGNRVSAKASIADLLLDGELRARAARSWCSQKENLSEAWWERPEENERKPVELQARDWMDSEDWFNDLNRWRWPQARFVLTTSERPREWRSLEDVQFHVADINGAVDIAVRAASREGRTKS